jgi:hypothetical protein
MGKGSKPRPYSVDQKTFDDNWDVIFKKDKNVQVRADQIQQGGVACGCGRSPTGKCIGWHGLSEKVYQQKKSDWELSEYKKQAKELWNDSCTSKREEKFDKAIMKDEYYDLDDLEDPNRIGN